MGTHPNTERVHAITRKGTRLSDTRDAVDNGRVPV